MPRYKPFNYDQSELIPVQFHRQIIPGTFEYALNYIVDHVMNVAAFEKRFKNETLLGGAPAYNPRILLKIIFYAYSRGILSSREIAKACEENIIFMALSAHTAPHFTTIASFIAGMNVGIKDLFLNVLLYCDQLGLIGKEMFAIDGCKISSNASKEWSGTKADFVKKKEKFKASIDFLVSKHKQEDESEKTEKSASYRDTRQKEEKAQENLEKKIKKIDLWMEKTEDKKGTQGNIKKSHLIDNESAKMVSSHGVVQGYNGVAAVDSKHQVIVTAEAFGEGAETVLLEAMINKTEENFKELGEEKIYEKAQVLADSGFHSEANMEMLKKQEIDAYIADKHFRKRDPRFKNADRYKKIVDNFKKKQEKKHFGAEDFILNEEKEKLICPAGKELYLKTANFKTKKGFYGKAYMGKETDCRTCELRSQCLRKESTIARQVVKLEGRGKEEKESFTSWMKQKIDSAKGRFLYSRRMGIVEPCFANIRDKLQLNRFTLRGKKKVDSQWKMFATLHNMLKAYRYGSSLAVR